MSLTMIYQVLLLEEEHSKTKFLTWKKYGRVFLSYQEGLAKAANGKSYSFKLCNFPLKNFRLNYHNILLL